MFDKKSSKYHSKIRFSIVQYLILHQYIISRQLTAFFHKRFLHHNHKRTTLNYYIKTKYWLLIKDIKKSKIITYKKMSNVNREDDDIDMDIETNLANTMMKSTSLTVDDERLWQNITSDSTNKEGVNATAVNILTPSDSGVEKNISATSTASKQINWSPNLVTSVAPPPSGNSDANVTLTPPTNASSNPTTISFQQLEHQSSTGSADSVPASRSNLSMNSPVRFLGVNHPGVIQ